jgi:hypothetical protein
LADKLFVKNSFNKKYQCQMKHFEDRLKGGHPNSLGKTVEIVAEVLQSNELFDELFNCYSSTDEIVRLRTSNAIKRICKEKKQILLPYIDRFLDEIAKIDQASTQWTLSQLFGSLEKDMTEIQIGKAKSIMKNNLANHTDWIVLNQTMETLANWSKKDPELKDWTEPHLRRLSLDKRKSVSTRAKKMLDTING